MKKDKPPVTFRLGSVLRPEDAAGSPHREGTAVDINQLLTSGQADLTFAGFVSDIIQILSDLPTGHYGIGLPVQDPYFPKGNLLEDMKKKAGQKGEKEAEKAEELAKAQSGTTGPSAPGTTVLAPPAKEEPTPVTGASSKPTPIPSSLTDGIRMYTSYKYRSSWNAQEGQWEDATDGQAYALLQSLELKAKLDDMRKGGYTLYVFPDNPNHLHLDKH